MNESQRPITRHDPDAPMGTVGDLLGAIRPGPVVTVLLPAQTPDPEPAPPGPCDISPP